MIKYCAAYLATAVVMLGLDATWIGVIAQSIYQKGIGHLMAPAPNLAVAGLFYVVFLLGLMIFAIARNLGWRNTLVSAAAYGFFTYATYDLTNLATLRDWPINVTVLDMLWGPFLCTVAAAAGKAVWNRFPPAARATA